MSKRTKLGGAQPPAAGDKVAQRLVEIRQRGMQHREATVAGVNIEARTVELSFSSETETVERWYGIEVLSHAPGACRLGRLTNKAPVLWMHDWDDMRGVVESARIDSDRKGRATIRLSKNDEGEELLRDIADGIVTKVSVGYMTHGIKLTEEREGIDVYTVTDWEPFEISLVSVPADDTVGIGRSAENPQVERAPGSQQNSRNNPNSSARQAFQRNETNMKHRTFRDAQGNLCRVAVNDAGEDVAGTLEVIEKAGVERQAGADAERARVRAITELGKQYAATDKAMEFIAEGKSPEDFQRELLHTFATKRANKPLDEQQQDANLGLTQKEVRAYSIFKLARALHPEATKAEKEAAAFEIECSRAAAEKYRKNDAKGIIIPNDVLADRAFGTGAAGTSGNGSAAIATNLLAGSFIDLLRNKAWVMRRARSMAGLVGNVDIPRQSSATQAYWVGEGGAPNASTPGLDQISLTPKTVGAYTDITRRLLNQATPDAEAIVRDDLLKVMALAIDKVAIYGTGTEFQPKGVKNYTGINAVDFASAGKPSFAELVDMETQIALDNADVDNMSYAFNAAIRGHAKTTLKFPAAAIAQGGTIWEPGNTVNGYGTDVSNQIATGDVFFGNWADLLIAMWGGLELRVDPYALSTSGGLRLIALQDIDINLRRVESFCYGSDTVS